MCDIRPIYKQEADSCSIAVLRARILGIEGVQVGIAVLPTLPAILGARGKGY